ncbi:MAG: hypothetical protein KAI02_07940 [Gammaproteobacteria bacterium]|nr:hypothetical protein [Gammaproteobacteria bacterium]
MKKSLYQAIFLSLSTLTVSQLAYSDVTVVYEQSNGTQKISTTMQVKDNKIRFTPANQNNNYSIYNSQTNQLANIDYAKKQYMMMDEKIIKEQMNQAKKRMDAMRQAMQEKMKDMPPEKKKQVEKMMNEHLSQVDNTQTPQTLEQKKTSRTETISGILCTVYEASLNGRKHSELCMTQADKMGIDNNDADALMNMQNFMKRIQRVAQTTMGNNTAITADIEGIPLHTTLYKEDGSISLDTRLINISRDKLSDKIITIPTDFTIKAIPKIGE